MPSLRFLFVVLVLGLSAAPAFADPAMAPATASAANKQPSAVVTIPVNRLPPDPTRSPPPAVTPELATVRAEVAQAIRLYDEIRAEQAGRIAELQRNVDAANKLFAEIQARQDKEVTSLRAEIPATKAAFTKANDELAKAISLLKYSVDEASDVVSRLKEDSAKASASLAASLKSQSDQLTALGAQSKAASDQLSVLKTELATTSKKLQSAFDGQQADLSSMAVDVAAARKLYGDISERQKVMDAAQAKLAAEVSNASSTIATLNAEVPKANAQLADAIKRHDDEEKRFAEVIAASQAASNKLVANAASATAGYEKVRTAQAAESASLIAQVNSVRDSFKKRADDIASQMTGVEAKLDAAGKQRADAIAEMAKLKAELAEATRSLPETLATIEAFKAELKEGRNLYAGIIAKQNELSTLQKGLEGSIGVLARNQNARTSDYNTQSAQLEALKAELAAAQSKLAETNDKIGATKNELAAVDSRLETIDRATRTTITGALATAAVAPVPEGGASVCSRLRANDANAWNAAIVRVLPQHVFEEVDTKRDLVWAVRNGTSEGFPIKQVLGKLGCGEPA